MKVCYIISDVQKSLAFEWISIRLKDKYDLSFILLNPGDSPLEQFLLKHKVSVTRVTYRGKPTFLTAFLKTRRILKEIGPDIVHCHLLDAQLIGLTAAKSLNIEKRIYTRHNSNFHHVYHPRGVRYDKWSNRMSTHIISISQSTDHTLGALENVGEEKIRKIPHGFDFDEFINVDSVRVSNVLRKWHIPVGHFVVGVVARHIEWKGIQYIIPAFRKFNEQYPDSVLVLANASGPFHEEISRSIKGLPVIQIPFEEDIAALYHTFSMYIHAPVDPIVEAFGQTYIESLAAGVPSVFTKSGIAAEFIQDGDNALVAQFKNSESIYSAMMRLISNDRLRERISKRGKEDVFSRFGIEKMIGSLCQLYDE